MTWISNFDLSALALIAILFLVYFFSRRFPSFSNKIYQAMLFLAFISVASSIATAYFSHHISLYGKTCVYVSEILYLCDFTIIPLVYFTYTLTITRSEIIAMENIPVWHFLPYSVLLLMIVVSPTTGFVFQVNLDGSISHGPVYNFIYVIIVFYLLSIARVAFVYRKKLEPLQLMSIFFSVVSSLAATVIQIVYPSYVVCNFVVILSLYLILLTLQNPYEFKDSLTKAFNRDAFIKIINNRINGQRRVTVLCVSVEGFKFINDKFGLKNGDKLLVQVSEYLSTICPKKSLFHITGTQFGLLLEDNTDENEIIETITKRFEEPFYLNGMEVQLWIHLCCLIYPHNVKNMNDVLDTIDYSLSEAKKLNTNCVIYGSEEILNKMHRETAILAALKYAIQYETFEVFYQPILDVEKNSYTSAEALVRLKDPSLGYIPPEEFIPMAEKNGSIIQIGEIVFKKVCRFLSTKVIPGSFYQPFSRVHVNLSVVQCMQDDLVPKFIEIMKRWNVPSSMINLEITETVAISSGDHLFKVMEKFEKTGIRFSLDDYGTGYSNTANIMRHKYSIIKLDKSLLWTAWENEQAMALLRHTVAMMQDLNMKVLMEGVETDRDIALLKELKVNYFQGYYYSEPISEDELLECMQHKAPI